MIRTVLGNIADNEIDCALSHEHICCYSEYLNMMSGEMYLDKKELVKVASAKLKELRENYGLNLFLDCTTVNIGRDMAMLREISEKSGVHIVCSTGFYYSEEPVINNTPVEVLAEHYINDAININAGMIKAAVERTEISPFLEKLLVASAIAQKKLNIPIVLHTNANNKNGLKALEILFENGVEPHCVTVGHLSDTDEIDYILEIAKLGCYVGLDRLHLQNQISDEYNDKKAGHIKRLSEEGFGDRILLSHDSTCFAGFSSEPKIVANERFDCLFKYILPRLDKETADRLIRKNPVKMLNCEK